MTSVAPSFWYQLVDSSTGQPYRKTDADKVFLGPNADVADFRKAVKFEWDEPGYLKEIPAGALTVYANRAEFDKRNFVEGKAEPLKPSDKLHAALGTEDEWLIAVVPSPILAAFEKNINSCEIPFYNDILHASECDNWLRCKDVIPSTKLKNLYIRESYKLIVSSIMHVATSSIISGDLVKVILTGTPGIGKSLFMIYLLHKLVKEGKRVLVIYHPFNIYYDGKGGIFELLIIPSPSIHSFWTQDLWCLFDAKSKKDDDINKLPYDHCHFVMSTSPRRDMINDFKKSPEPQVFYMPLWTETELEAIVPLFHDVDEWRSRFKILGGIPRRVLEATTRDPTDILDDACKVCSLDDCIKAIGMNSEITDKAKVVHCLVHVTSEPPFTKSSVCYASPTALNMIVQKKGSEARNKMRDLLASCEGNPLTAALCGYIFEPYAIEWLEKGGQFTCRQLVHGNTQSVPVATVLEIPSSKKTVADKVLSSQTHYQLHVPKAENYVAIDAWIPGIGAFQITVGKKHNIKSGVRDDLTKLGRGASKLYWLLPPLYYYSFTKKTPHDIEQYAVLIPYPE